MKLSTILSALLLLFVFVSCKKDATTDTPPTAKTIEDYLVKNNEITGWALGSNKWTANNITELTVHIDGAAELYRRYGFVEGSSQDYRGTVNSAQATLKLTVFNQATKANALGVYNDPGIGFSGAITWTGGAGEAAQYLRNDGLSQQLCFYRNNFFVYLEIVVDTDESLNIMKQFALNVDAKAK